MGDPENWMSSERAEARHAYGFGPPPPGEDRPTAAELGDDDTRPRRRAPDELTTLDEWQRAAVDRELDDEARRG